MGNSLYEIAEIITDIEKMREEGLTEEELKASVESAMLMIKKNVDVYSYYQRENKSNIDAISEEIKRLQLRKKQLTNRNNFFKEKVIEFMQDNNIKKLRGSIKDLTLTSSKSVEIVDGTKVSEGYIRTKIVHEYDKVKIGKDLKAGIKVAGARLKIKRGLR